MARVLLSMDLIKVGYVSLDENMTKDSFEDSAIWSLYKELALTKHIWTVSSFKKAFIKYVNEEFDRSYLRGDAIYITLKEAL